VRPRVILQCRKSSPERKPTGFGIANSRLEPIPSQEHRRQDKGQGADHAQQPVRDDPLAPLVELALGVVQPETALCRGLEVCHQRGYAKKPDVHYVGSMGVEEGAAGGAVKKQKSRRIPKPPRRRPKARSDDSKVTAYTISPEFRAAIEAMGVESCPVCRGETCSRGPGCPKLPSMARILLPG